MLNAGHASIVLAAGLLAGGCAAGAQEAPGANATAYGADDALPGDGALKLEDSFDEASLRAMGPSGWQRLARYGNWDFVGTETWIWIVSQPDCDRATALEIFWKASPDYYLEFASEARMSSYERADYALVKLIRERWLAGAYTHSEYAFDPDKDVGPIDMAALRRRYGARADAMLPAAMRVRLKGRGTPSEGVPLPGVFMRGGAG
ncbi:DUF4274 domain-containing protein [Sphingomonas canadensis]|uniref:DUF4274 domain-containing protein n=1 Tax=Sphingomonas canadensis TaxID=1219257 RepID=A0ABW3H722_9SPHN|nr:DUF4274 domain-containing protein [Sphingomonas canadensis]MCW3837067.1 DUF4274 domain-containing protein [Sphingomonas canadensis]